MAAFEFIAPPAWQAIDFISDLHLAEDTPRGFEAFSKYVLQTSADAVFIVGDLFEAWIGDDSRAFGFEARCVEVLREAAARRPMAFMVGNRDFLVGPAMLADCGIAALSDPTVLSAFGTRALLSHGDELCIGDVAYQKLRVRVRDPRWQASVLARPLAERRAMGQQMRAESQREQADRLAGQWFDVDAPAALTWLADADAKTLIHGHTHRPGTETLAPGVTRHVLSDWELDHGTARRAEVLRWQASGFTRLSPQAATVAASASLAR